MKGTEMIIGNKENEVDRFLQTSRFRFHITGSFYFNTETPTSDKDFFAQESPELRVELQKLGFKRLVCPGDQNSPDELESEDYNSVDANIAEIWRRECGLQYDIQLVRNFDQKLRVQTMIKSMELPSRLHSSKETMRAIWAGMYRLDAIQTKQGFP
jgi:hypothetical protein